MKFRSSYQDVLKLKRRREKRLKIFLFIPLSIFFLFSIFYFLFFSGIFLVKEIEIRGNEEVSKEKILEEINSYFNRSLLFKFFKPFSNIIFTNSENLEKELLEKNLIIDRLKINKIFFQRKLIIEIKEKKAIGVWCRFESDLCFYFDKNGFLFKSAPRFSGNLFLVIDDAKNKELDLGLKFNDLKLLEKILKTADILNQLKIVEYSNFYLPKDSFGEFWIKTKEGWFIYLDKEVDLETQLIALKKILDEKISLDKRNNLSYIDLRINNRVYYKEGR